VKVWDEKRWKIWLLVKLFDHQRNSLCEKKVGEENRAMGEGNWTLVVGTFYSGTDNPINM
jgi:hypothetical protein